MYHLTLRLTDCQACGSHVSQCVTDSSLYFHLCSYHLQKVFLKVCSQCPAYLWDLAKGFDVMTVRDVRITVDTPLAIINSLLDTRRFRLRHLRMDDLYNAPLDLSHTTLAYFTANEVYNSPIVLPPAILEATFGHRFDKPLRLPPTLKKLTVGGAFDRAVVIPKSLEEFNCGYHFDRMITFPTGCSLTKLTVGYMFDQRKIHFPESLRHLVLNGNRLVPFPRNLQILELGSLFTKPITLPEGLLEVIFGVDYQLPIQDLPSSLEHVTCKSSRAALVDLRNCGNLKSVTCTGSVGQTHVHLPQTSTLVKAVFKGSCAPTVTLPSTLEHLEWSGSSSRQFANLHRLSHLVVRGGLYTMVELPATLLTLEVGGSISKHVTLPEGLLRVAFSADERTEPIEWPSSLEHVEIKGSYSHAVDLRHCINLISATFAQVSSVQLPQTSAFRQAIFRSKVAETVVLPPSTTHLEWYSEQSIQLPQRLSHVAFGGDHNEYVILPASVRYCRLDKGYKREVVLPDGVERVYFGEGYPHLVVLPGSVIEVGLPESYDTPVELPVGCRRVVFN